MSINAGDKITADSAYINNRTYEETLANISIRGRFLGSNDTEVTVYHWVRWEEPDTWLITTTYGKDEYTQIVDGSDVKVYRSKQAGNVGNDPETDLTETYWYLVDTYTYDSNTFDKAFRVKFIGDGSTSGPGDECWVKIWKVTWPAGIETETLIFNEFRGNMRNGIVYNFYQDAEPGYYKIWAYVSSQGTNSNNRTQVFGKVADTTIQFDKPVRIFDEKNQAPLTRYQNLLTDNIAKAGRIGTDGYLGGDFEVDGGA